MLPGYRVLFWSIPFRLIVPVPNMFHGHYPHVFGLQQSALVHFAWSTTSLPPPPHVVGTSSSIGAPY